MTWFFDPLPRRAFTTVLIDPPWRFSAGTKSRPQHYDRMTFADIMAMPVRDLLLPEGGRVMLWITAPLLDRIPDISKAWRLRYSSALPWIKTWGSEDALFLYSNSLARGTGFEVMGNAEYLAILKAGKPHSIKGNPFPGVIVAPRRQHSRKPPHIHEQVEAKIPGPWCEIFARETRAGWAAWGNQVGKLDEVAA